MKVSLVGGPPMLDGREIEVDGMLKLDVPMMRSRSWKFGEWERDFPVEVLYCTRPEDEHRGSEIASIHYERGEDGVCRYAGATAICNTCLNEKGG